MQEVVARSTLCFSCFVSKHSREFDGYLPLIYHQVFGLAYIYMYGVCFLLIYSCSYFSSLTKIESWGLGCGSVVVHWLSIHRLTRGRGEGGKGRGGGTVLYEYCYRLQFAYPLSKNACEYQMLDPFRSWNICIRMMILWMRPKSKHATHLCFAYTLHTA